MDGIQLIRAIQSISTPALDRFFGLVTNLHHELVYMVVLPLLFWLYDKRVARYMFSVFALGFWTNDLLKSVFVGSRPDPSQVRVLYPETTHGTPGFPSGHAQTPLVFWGAIALQAQRRWITLLAAVLVFLIGFSRLYAGLHWPLDVLGGWAFGAAVLAGLYLTRSFWSGEGQGLAARLFWSVALPAGAALITWTINPPGLDGQTLTMIGAYCGLMAGSALEEEWVGFDPRRGGPGAQAAKVVLGLLLIVAAKEGLEPVLPDTPVGSMLRYLLVTLLVTLGVPWLFHRLIPPPVGGGVTRAQ